MSARAGVQLRDPECPRPWTRYTASVYNPSRNDQGREKTMTWRKALVFVALLLGVAARDSAGSAGFVIIVNAGNPVPVLTRRAVSDIFLKRLTTWRHGERAKPVDLPVSSPVRESFTRAVHGKQTR